MRKNSFVFVDKSAWIAIMDPGNPNHAIATNYFEDLLAHNGRIVTNNYIIDETIQYLKGHFDGAFARQFLSIIDESVLTIAMRIDWISRRVRRSALENYLNSKNENLEMRHFFILESLKRKRIDILFSFDKSLKHFNYPVMPQAEK